MSHTGRTTSPEPTSCDFYNQNGCTLDADHDGPCVTGRTTSWIPTPREGCPERCQGHYAPCEHRTDWVACDACIEQRGKDGPILCEVPDA